MELLSSTALHFKPSLSRPSTSRVTTVPVSSHLSPNKIPTNYQKLTATSSRFLIQRPLTRSNSNWFTVYASAVTLNQEMENLPAEIEVTETQEPNSRLRLSVKVPPIVCEDCYKKVMAEFMKAAKVPGFRPGKNVPESILVNYVGKKNVQRATIESILRRTIPHAMSSVTGRALKDSFRIVTKFSEMEQSYSTMDFLRYDVVVDVAPEVKWIPENGYKNLKIVVELDRDIEAQRASEEELKRQYKTLGSLRIVTDRGLQVGDVVILDISATTIEEDQSNAQTIPVSESKGFRFDTDGDKIIPGFVDSIIGIQRGETMSFPLVFPESWNQENLRGVRAQFTVECKELFYRDLPELNDSLAERLVPGCSTLNQVRESLLERCKQVEQAAKEQATDNAILNQLCQMIEVDIPQSLFEEQGRQLYGAKLLEIQAKMKLTEEQLASFSSPKAVNEFIERQRENIATAIKQNLAIGDIFKRENLQFPTEELVKEVESSISEFKRHKQEYDEERVKEQVQEVLEGAKVLEWLKERADIKYITK